MKMHPLLDPEGGENEVCPLACAAEVAASLRQMPGNSMWAEGLRSKQSPLPWQPEVSPLYPRGSDYTILAFPVRSFPK